MAAETFYECKDFTIPVMVRARCGRPGFFDRDCVSSDRVVPLSLAICNAHSWNGKHSARFVEMWSADNRTRLFRMNSKPDSLEKSIRCYSRLFARDKYRAPLSGDSDPFTVDVPGVSDILKIKAWEDPALGYERFQRFKTRNSAVPKVLQWLPPLLTKLDNAQDLLFTGLALAWPLMKFIGRRFLWPVSILLTINDVMNLFT